MADPFTILLTLGTVFVLRRTIYGRKLYALGSNIKAAELALIRPVAIWAITFGLSAMFAALAGILLLGFTGSSSATVGTPYLFQTVSAVVIGGTALIGGRGGFVGTVAGAIMLMELRTFLIGMGFSDAMVQSSPVSSSCFWSQPMAVTAISAILSEGEPVGRAACTDN